MTSTTTELKKTGLKATTPRLRILELFDKSQDRHLSADDVHRMLLEESSDIGLATVYRALTQFEEAGVLERHYFESTKAVFEKKKTPHHDHLVCLTCGHVEEFVDEEIERRQKRIAKERGFVIQGHSLCLHAECIRKGCDHRQPETASAPKE